jgi:hypothetical protein
VPSSELRSANRVSIGTVSNNSTFAQAERDAIIAALKAASGKISGHRVQRVLLRTLSGHIRCSGSMGCVLPAHRLKRDTGEVPGNGAHTATKAMAAFLIQFHPTGTNLEAAANFYIDGRLVGISLIGGRQTIPKKTFGYP